jgi:hypothetical protein
MELRLDRIFRTNEYTIGELYVDYSVIDSGQYQWAENIRIIANDNSSTGVMQNIEGFQLS